MRRKWLEAMPKNATLENAMAAKGLDFCSRLFAVEQELEHMPDEERRIPYTRIIYFGDGMTDIPSMKMVKNHGGTAIAVYKPHSHYKAKAIKLLKDNRVNFALPADYRDGKEIDCVIKTILNKISTERDLEILKKKEDRKKQTV